MVFGEYPFKGEDNGDILLSISEGNYVIPKQVSWELVSLITDIFNPDHENRITLKEIQKSNWVRGII
jgi:serine/threonine protein kinase